MSASTITVDVTDRIEELRVAFAGVCADLEPDRLSGVQAAAAHAALIAVAKLAGGAALRLARRVEQAKVWHDTGDASAVDYLARTGGVSRHQAREALDTSWRLTGCAATDRAVRHGRLSAAQAAAVADGAQADPDAETALLVAAESQPVTRLRDQVRAVKAAADLDPSATHRRLHRGRQVRRWTDGEGAYNLAVRTTAVHGARIDAALQPAIDEVFTAARAAGQREPVEAYAVDALVNLITAGAGADTAVPTRGAAAEPPAPPASPSAASAPDSGVTLGTSTSTSTLASAAATGSADGAAGGGSSDTPAASVPNALVGSRRRSARREAKIIVHIDAAALTRGDTRAGERCEIAGVGSVPVAAVRALLPEAFVAVVIHDAVDVRAVAHAGRQVTAAQRTALEARGYHCEVPTCASRHRLEIDHLRGWATTRITRLDDLAWLCPVHHHAKTHDGWRLHGPPRHRQWTRHPHTHNAGRRGAAASDQPQPADGAGGRRDAGASDQPQPADGVGCRGDAGARREPDADARPAARPDPGAAPNIEPAATGPPP